MSSSNPIDADVTKRLEIDYETAREINPGIIYCSITGFGQTGPWADIPGHDLVVQSVTGVMGTGPEGSLPVVPGFQAADYAGCRLCESWPCLPRSIGGATPAKAATRYFDVRLPFQHDERHCGSRAWRAFGGFPVTTVMELYGANPRYATYRTRDGKAVAVSLLEARIWNSFCKLIDRARSNSCRRRAGAPPHRARRSGRALSRGDRQFLPVQGSR